MPPGGYARSGFPIDPDDPCQTSDSLSNLRKHLLYTFIHAQSAGIERQLRVLGRLVRVIDAREVLDFPASSAGVQPFDVPPLTLVERGGHVDLDKVATQLPDKVP